ncbi:hypothetical protein PRIPAC_71380 [Pristionchus pacificus]|uniref:Zinc finger protein n=1 Tax=Pristionchus pacificus TaxID=54126 RepID=A0A2A6CG58_PRIPA|nr:hypothetical protein PRIPAC_70008 [Pristionchus pacificus]KAF8382238.1 hypothetical protein PRIPAC_71380 [Pristionchus pacificus]|eukprot:PDM77077.1 zinc finger protein [Pristionchus pacificus]
MTKLLLVTTISIFESRASAVHTYYYNDSAPSAGRTPGARDLEQGKEGSAAAGEGDDDSDEDEERKRKRGQDHPMTSEDEDNEEEDEEGEDDIPSVEGGIVCMSPEEEEEAASIHARTAARRGGICLESESIQMTALLRLARLLLHQDRLNMQSWYHYATRLLGEAAVQADAGLLASCALVTVGEKVGLREELCASCRASFGESPFDRLPVLPCLHIFHHECIARWLNNANCCPVCRYKLEKPLDPNRRKKM